MRYHVGQQLLCFHGPHLYDAKCVRYEPTRGYFVHYIGWNHNWDEWVPESRLLDDNEKNRQIQVRLEAQNRGQSVGGTGNTPLTPMRRRNSRQQRTSSDAETVLDLSLLDTVQSEQEYQNAVEVNVEIPECLRPWLIDDWNLICRQGKVISQPSAPTVRQIVHKYAQHARQKPDFDSDTAEEFVEGILEYFNAMLPTRLLYDAERPQAEKLLHPVGFPMGLQAQPCDVYGSVHLLRLFVKIGKILTMTWLNEEQLSRLLKMFDSFLAFMADDLSFLNMQEYVEAERDEETNTSESKPSSTSSSSYEQTGREPGPEKIDQGARIGARVLSARGRRVNRGGRRGGRRRRLGFRKA